MTKKKDKKEKKTIKEIINSTPFLLTVFLLLLITVIILGCIIHKKDYEKAQAFDSNMVIPLYEIETSFTFGIDAKALSKLDSREYVIKLTNYKGEKVEEEEMTYQVFVENLTDSVISLRKGDSKKNLMTDQKNTLIDEVMESSSEKEETYIYVHLDSFKKIEDGDFIHVKIIRETL